jgi:hypothetical protein
MMRLKHRQWRRQDLGDGLATHGVGRTDDCEWKPSEGVGVYIVGRLVRARLGQMVQVVWSG